MEIAIMAGSSAEWYVNVNPAHGVKFGLKSL